MINGLVLILILLIFRSLMAMVDQIPRLGKRELIKGTHFYILFVVTAAGVVLCGSPKSSPVHRS